MLTFSNNALLKAFEKYINKKTNKLYVPENCHSQSPFN